MAANRVFPVFLFILGLAATGFESASPQPAPGTVPGASKKTRAVATGSAGGVPQAAPRAPAAKPSAPEPAPSADAPSKTSPAPVAEQMAESSSAQARARGVEMLSEDPGPAGLDMCVEALLDPDPTVRKAACESLLTFDPIAVCDRVLTGLCSDDPGLVAGIDWALPALRASIEDTSILVLASADQPREYRLAAAYALGRINSRKAGRTLIEQTWSGDPQLAVYCAMALNSINDPATLLDLVPLTGHPLPEVRVAALRALARMRGPDAVNVIVAAVRGEEADPNVRAEAAALLGAVGGLEIRDAGTTPEGPIPAAQTIIGALIDALHAEGPPHFAAADALREVTGADCGDQPEPWLAWFGDWLDSMQVEEEPPPLVASEEDFMFPYDDMPPLMFDEVEPLEPQFVPMP